ncbi:MAG: gamma-glutamylcyclotransferase family protein [Luteolibacter sp.]
MSETLHRVFVYGTLRSGGSNHHRMAGAARIASAVVRGRLYRIDWYPGVVLDAEADEVVGEIYDVSDRQFEALNEYEGDEYHCVEIEARGYQPPDETFYVKLWEWKGTPDPERRIPHGDWLVASRKIYPVFTLLAWLLLVFNLIGLPVFSSRAPAIPAGARVTFYIGIFVLPLFVTLCSWLSGHRHEVAPRWQRLQLVISGVLILVNALAVVCLSSL